MSKYWLLDFNSILDDHLASPQVKNLTIDSGNTGSVRSAESNAYSFRDSIFDNGTGKYTKMKSMHITFNLKSTDYDYHYDDITDYSGTILSTNFNGGRYCIMIESNNDRSGLYDFFDENAAIRDRNYDFGVSSATGLENWLLFLRPNSYAFSSEQQTKPTDGFTDEEYWGYKDFKIIAKTNTSNATTKVFFVVNDKVIFDFPIDGNNFFYILNTKSWWEEITATKFNDLLNIQKFYFKPKSSGYGTYDDFSRPTSLEYSINNGITWEKIGGSFPATVKGDGTEVSSTDYTNTVLAIASNYDTSAQMKSSHGMNYVQAPRYRKKLTEWGIEWTDTTNANASTNISDDDYTKRFKQYAPILLYSMNITNGRSISSVIRYHHIDAYGIPKNATHIKFWTGDDRQRYGIEINGANLGDLDMWDPYFHVKEKSLKNIPLNGILPEKFESLLSFFNGSLANNNTRLFDGKGYYNFVQSEDIHENYNSQISTVSAIDISSVEYANLNRGNAWRLGYPSDYSNTDTPYGYFNFFNSSKLTFNNDLSNGFTFSFYINQDYSSEWGHIFGTWDNPDNFWIGTRSGEKMYYNIAGKTGDFDTSIYSNDTWHHILINFNGSLLKIFLNGAEKVSESVVWNDFSGMDGQWTMGNDKNNSSKRFRGKIASFLILKEAVTPNQAHTIHDYIHKKYVLYNEPVTTYTGTLDQTIYRELHDRSKFEAFGGKIILNSYSNYSEKIKYTLNIGTYYITDIPDSHPIALLNNGMEDKISYQGIINKKSTKQVNTTNSSVNGTYDFFSGDIRITVHSDFSGCSLYCHNHGYMGGENLLKFDENVVDNNIDTVEYGIYHSENAWVMLKTDGTIFNWGDTQYGGVGVFGSKLKNIRRIYKSFRGFVALRNDGVAIPISYTDDNGYGRNDSISTDFSIIPELTNIRKVFKSYNTFFALKYDGTGVFWGTGERRGYMDISHNLNNIVELCTNSTAYAALKNDGTVITWGRPDYGGLSDANELKNIKLLCATRHAFSALRYDGTVTAWGHASYGGNLFNQTATTEDDLKDIIHIASNEYAVIAINKDRKLVAVWGHASYGTISQVNESDRTNIKKVYCLLRAFLIVNDDNKGIIFGNVTGTVENVSKVAIGQENVAVVKADGSVEFFGDASYAPDEQITDVVDIFANTSFTALKSDNSVVVWGKKNSNPHPSNVFDSYIAGTTTPYTDSEPNINIFDVFPGRYQTYLEKENGDFIRIGHNDYAAQNYTKNYSNEHKIGSKYNRYTRRKKNIFTLEIGTHYTSLPETNFTERYFKKYQIPQIKKEFYRFNYSDPSYNAFNNCFTNDILNENIRTFIINELKNESNAVLKSDKRHVFVQLLLKNTDKKYLTMNTTDLVLEDVVSKKSVEIYKSGEIIDIVNRDAEKGLYFSFENNDFVVIKSKEVEFIYKRSVTGEERYYVIEYNENLTNLNIKPISGCENFNFNNKTGFFIKDDIFQLDGYKFQVGSLIDITDITQLTEIKIKNVYANDGAFVSLKNNGFIHCWGKINYGGEAPTDISNVKNIFTTPDTFTALLNNDNLITWGNTPTGQPIIKSNQKLKKTQLLNKINSLSGNINNVIKNNDKTLLNFSYENNNITIPKMQFTDKKIINFINQFDSNLYSKVEKLKLVNNEIKKSDIVQFLINSNVKRNLLFDALFINNIETNIIINSEALDLQNFILKEKVNIIEQNKVVMNVRRNSTQINKKMGVYANLTDISDNVIVEIDDNTSFKVIKTTNTLSNGKYIIELLKGTITIYGRYNGTFNTINEKIGLFEDNDEIYINNIHFFFNGFGTNGLNNAENQTYNNVAVHTTCVAYLDASGGVHAIGQNATKGNSFTDSTYGIYACMNENFDTTKDIVHIVANYAGFCALTKHGRVFSWGDRSRSYMKGYYSWQEDITHLNENIIQIYANQLFYVALKENREIIVWGMLRTIKGSPYIYTKTGTPSSTYSLEYTKLPIISPIKNVHEIILSVYAGAVITIDRKLITFGAIQYGGDYTDETYGIYRSIHSIEGKSPQTTVLENIRKVVAMDSGFAALDYDGCVYVWGNTTLKNRDISLNSGVIDIESFNHGILAKYENTVKIYSNNNAYHSAYFNAIEQDVSQNCHFFATNYSVAFLRPADNMLFISGYQGNNYAGNFSSNNYKYDDRTDIVNNHQMRNVAKVYSSHASFGIIKTDGSAVFVGHDSNTNYSTYPDKLHGGNLDSHVKKLFTNGYTWCALKEDETIVTWTNHLVTDHDTYGKDFGHTVFGINSERFGGNTYGGTKRNSVYNHTKVGFVKNVYPIAHQGYMAHINNNGEHDFIFWGWSNQNSTKVSEEDFSNFRNPSKTSNIGFINSAVNTGNFSRNIRNMGVDNNIDLPYKKTIKVTVETIDGANKFVFDNDVSNNPLTDKKYNFTFDLTDNSLENHPFKIVSNPYTNKSQWRSYDTLARTNSGYDAVLSNKYNIIKCETHGTGMGSLYNDPATIVDISEGEVVETLFNNNVKTTIASYNVLNYDNSIPDNSLNIVTFTNYNERSAVFDLVKRVIAFKLDYLITNRDILSVPNTQFNFNDPIIFHNNILVFDYNTKISLQHYADTNALYYGNLIKKNHKITIIINSSKKFSIEKISEENSTDKYKINIISGVMEFRTNAANYIIENNYTILNSTTNYDESTHYFVENDSFIINDIKFNILNNGFLTSGRQIIYKEIHISKDSNNNILYNNKLVKPSFEHGIHYKLIDNTVENIIAPLYFTKNTF